MEKAKATTNKPATLCWKCARACGGCSWSDGSFTPVEGWKATPTVLRGDRGVFRHKMMRSYYVQECPLFENDLQRNAECDMMR